MSCALALAFIAAVVPPQQDSPSVAILDPAIMRAPHPKLTPDFVFTDDLQAVVIAVQTPAGQNPRADQINFMQSVLQDVPPNRVFDSDGHSVFAARLNGNEVRELLKNPLVRAIEPERMLVPAMDEVIYIVDAVEAWQMIANEMNLTGTGKTIAIIDTAIDWSHPALVGKNAIPGCYLNCTISGQPCVLTCPDPITFPTCSTAFHGIWCAGIAGAEHPIPGIARGAKLIDLRIATTGAGNSCTSTALRVRQAIEWCTEHAAEFNIGVISISWTFTAPGGQSIFSSACDSFFPSTFAIAIPAALEAGLTIVSASGNQGSNLGISAPGCITGVIPVAGSTNLDAVWPSSNYSTQVKLFAPAQSIQSTGFNGNNVTSSGTSASCPMVAGCIAVMQQLLGIIGESMTPAELEQVLFDTGDPVTNLQFAVWRRINLAAALQQLIDQFVNPADINVDGTVNEVDLMSVISAWGPCTAPPATCPSDIDDNNTVNVLDLLMVIKNWSP